MATDGSTMRARLRTILLVAGVAFFSAVIITGAYDISHERILENERTRLIASLNSVVDRPSSGEILATELDLPPGDDDARVEQVFAMRQGATLVGWVYAFIAPAGYNGPIRLLLGIAPDGKIMRARVLRHRETPGLGDAIETEKSDWIRQFDGKSLGAPPVWALKADNGSFDALTGATVTPRAVVAAIESVLRYHSIYEPALTAELEKTPYAPL